MDPSLQLVFDEIRRKFDEFDARMERRFSQSLAAMEQRRAIDELRIGGLPRSDTTQLVVADNWGGLFEQPRHTAEDRGLYITSDVDFAGFAFANQIRDEGGLTSTNEPSTGAPVLADNWGGFLDEIPTVFNQPVPAPDAFNSESVAGDSEFSYTNGEADPPVEICVLIDTTLLSDGEDAMATIVVVVVGNQSSMLESLPSISLPRGQGISTRVPLVLRLLDDSSMDSRKLLLEYSNSRVEITTKANVAEVNSIYRSHTSWLPGGMPAYKVDGINQCLGVLDGVSVIQRAPEVFEEMPKHISETLRPPPMHISNKVFLYWKHMPWPPPTELQLVSCDAGLRPLPWPSFNMVEGNSVMGYSGRLWKPPWSRLDPEVMNASVLSKLKLVHHASVHIIVHTSTASQSWLSLLMVTCWNYGAAMTYMEISERMASAAWWITRCPCEVLVRDHSVPSISCCVFGHGDLHTFLEEHYIAFRAFTCHDQWVSVPLLYFELLADYELLETRIASGNSLQPSVTAPSEFYVLHSISLNGIDYRVTQPVGLLKLLLQLASTSLLLLNGGVRVASLLTVGTARWMANSFLLHERKIVEVTQINIKTLLDYDLTSVPVLAPTCCLFKEYQSGALMVLSTGGVCPCWSLTTRLTCSYVLGDHYLGGVKCGGSVVRECTSIESWNFNGATLSVFFTSLPIPAHTKFSHENIVDYVLKQDVTFSTSTFSDLSYDMSFFYYS